MGWPGTRTPTTGQTEAGRACASASCPPPMLSFNRRSGAWGFAPLRRRGSTSCGWASQRQSVYQLDSIARTGNGVAVRWVHAPCEKPDELIIAPFRREPLRCLLLWWLVVDLTSTIARSALAARFDHATSLSGTHPKKVHHPRCIPNIAALREESLAVKLHRNLSQTHPMRA